MSELPVTICPLKLKTLKDIEWDLGLIPENNLDLIDEKIKSFYEYKQKLQAEAVKWVKEYRNSPQPDPEMIQAYSDIITFIKHFFNLTEEELK